ncbi:AsmA-like C-terminal region-containing protein [Zavarzinella formosa]|uniref:AsmA-like C-terminal region-containing protein n=1 Tax=Zavarzinella formosa TaxID=360055 RepID=UPI0012F7B31C|nr:AsmA-like C-terminal region-containing protein [Zavarzinella formosa]
MTPARRGLIRLVRVCFVLVAVGYGAWWLYDYAFKPGEVRRRVYEALEGKFDGVDIELGSARMRPFLGGVNITDLKLIRRDDPSRTPFLHVPKATIWFDKSLALQKLPLGKIELEDSHIRLIRDANGSWNVQGLMTPGKKGDGPAPVLVLKKARVSIIDQKQGLSGELEIKNTDLTIVNDPETLYTVEARGEASPLGKFHLSGKFEENLGASGRLQVREATIGASLSRLLSMLKPEAAQAIDGLDGRLGLDVKLDWKANRPIMRGLDVEVNFGEGVYRNPDLPAAVTDLTAKFHFRDGELKADPITGKLAGANFQVKLDMDFRDLMNLDPKAPPPDIIGTMDERIRRLEMEIKDIQINAELFALLPPKYQEIQSDYLPRGAADFSFEQYREGDRTIRKGVFHPKGMSATYEGFAYPVDHIRGTIDATFSPDQPTKLVFDLAGEGNGQAVTCKGTVTPGAERDVDLVISGSSVKLDKTLIEALPGKIPKFVQSLRATAVGDFTAKIRHNARIRQEHGPDVNDNEFDIFIRDGSLNYDEFPYPLKNLTGNLYIRTVPDHPTIQPMAPGQNPVVGDSEVGSVAFKNFRAIGPGGTKVKLSGGKVPEEGGMLLSINAYAESMQLSGDLQKAVGKLHLEKAWSTFEPSGRMNCNIEVRIHERCPKGSKQPVQFMPARDLELGLSFNGASICPKFFPYAISELAGKVYIAKSRVEIHELRGRHGPTEVSLSGAEIRLPAAGGFWASLSDLKFSPVVTDREFLTALPKGLRRAWEGLEFNGPVTIHAKELVIDDQGKRPEPLPNIPQVAGVVPVTARGTMGSTLPVAQPTFFWDATLTFQNASFKTGMTWEKATGQFATTGRYEGDRLGRVKGNLAVDQAMVLKQPVEMVSAHLDVDPSKPDILLFPWIKAKIYGGEVGGQARVVMGSPLKFDLSLSGTRLRLEEIAAVNKLGPKTHLTGLSTARLKLSNPVDPTTKIPTLEGEGEFDIPNGKLLDLPVILDVIKLARLRPMDETMFEEAHAVFRIRGNRMKFDQLDLIGNAFSLGGEGEMNLDGTRAGFEFYTVWTNIRDFFGGKGEIPARLSSNLYKIKVSGNLGDEKPRVEQVPLPVVMEPVRRMLDRAGGR